MKPYYEDARAGIVIYHGDCREVLPEVEADAVVTDPPYGINAARDRNSQRWGWIDYGVNGWDAAPPDDETLRLSATVATRAVLWGGNYFLEALPFVPRGKWLIWDKGQTNFSLADCEMAWCSWEGAIRRIWHSRGAALQDGKSHPTQKPEAVMRWTINQLEGGEEKNQTILDPFMGSGTTLRDQEASCDWDPEAHSGVALRSKRRNYRKNREAKNMETRRTVIEVSGAGRTLQVIFWPRNPVVGIIQAWGIRFERELTKRERCHRSPAQSSAARSRVTQAIGAVGRRREGICAPSMPI